MLNELFDGLNTEMIPPQNPQMINHAQYRFAAFHESRLIGLIYGFSCADTSILQWVFVNEQFRNIGIGKKLADNFIRNFHNCKRIEIIANPHALSFYSRLGFIKRKDVTPMILSDSKPAPDRPEKILASTNDVERLLDQGYKEREGAIPMVLEMHPET